VAISTKIDYAKLGSLSLDPNNPRLGRELAGPKTTQSKVLEAMEDWDLEDLAVSFRESGFWPQEALLVVEEQLYGKQTLVVVEGNRRLGALKLLYEAAGGNSRSKKWQGLAEGLKPTDSLFEEVPILRAASRKDIVAFLGFRHVTGIMEWNPAEKAEYIARMVDAGASYEEVRRKIGSKVETVRRNYISFRLLLQMEESESISVKNVEEKFSVLFLSLRTSGVQQYLHVDIMADPKQVVHPVPKDRLKALEYFASWLFGNEEQGVDPIVRDSRQVDNFSRILESKEAVEYLESKKSPSFEFAYRLAGGDEIEIISLLSGAADNVEEALSRVHLHKGKPSVKKVVDRLASDLVAVLKHFPSVRETAMESLKQ
jgi:transposase-like protein